MSTSEPTSSHGFRYEADHPVFAGHFPGHPVLPGVLLLAEVMRGVRRSAALAERLGDCPEIASAKFLAPLAPGQAAEVRLQADGAGARFEIVAAELRIASGQLRGASRGGAA